MKEKVMRYYEVTHPDAEAVTVQADTPGVAIAEASWVWKVDFREFSFYELAEAHELPWNVGEDRRRTGHAMIARGGGYVDPARDQHKRR